MKKIGIFLATFVFMLGIVIVVNKKPKVSDLPPPPPQQQSPLIVVPPTYGFEQAKASITEAEVRQHLSYLCSDALEGRMSGMKGNSTAANYLSSWMNQHSIKTQNQSFTVEKMNEYKEKSSGTTANIIGSLEGTSLKNEVIIIGAHFDHIGWGSRMSQTPSRREIHPGADDNGTGTVVVMMAAKAFSLLKGQNQRTIVFMHFSGEEMGLIGAKYYCQNPIWTLNNTLVMINQDMVGRLNGKRNLTASGSGKVSAIAQVVNSLTGYPFKVSASNDTGGGSDHAAFAQKGVPVICFHTGQHSQYHTPDDTVRRIDITGLHQICQMVFELAWKIDKINASPSKVFYENIKVHPNWMK